MAKPHDEVRAPPRQAGQGREFRPKRGDLHRLVDERVRESQRRRLKGTPLTRAPHTHPVVFVAPLRDEDGDAGQVFDW